MSSIFDVQVTEPAREHRDVRAIMIEVRPGRTDNDIEVQADVCRRTKPGGGIVGRKTDRVIARVMRGEREMTLGGTTRRDDRMVTLHFRDLH